MKNMMMVVAVSLFVAGTAVQAEEVMHGGDIIFAKPVKSVTFSHKTHVEDMGLSCDMCHSRLFEMAQVAQDKADFTMDSLYKGKYCGACHDGNMAFASNTRCASCHSGVKGMMGSASH